MPLYALGDLVEYRCVIPEGLEKEITLIGKDGSKNRRDAHAIYGDCHKQGWLNSVRLYLSKGKLPLLEMERENIQEWGIMTDARRIGNLEAQAMILKAELVYKPKELEDMLKRLLKEKQKDGEPGAAANGDKRP